MRVKRPKVNKINDYLYKYENHTFMVEEIKGKYYGVHMGDGDIMAPRRTKEQARRAMLSLIRDFEDKLLSDYNRELARCSG